MLPPKFNSDHKRNIQIYNDEALNGAIYSRGISGDIYVLLSYIMYEAVTEEETKLNLFQIKKYICNFLGYSDTYTSEKKIDWLYFLRQIQSERKKEEYLESIKENKILNQNIMNQYIPLLHTSWVKDGFTEPLRKYFNIRFDLQSERIVFPCHNKDGQLIGVKGRYVGNNKEEEEEKKYIYLYPFYKSIELFNLHRAKKFIEKRKRIIVFEGAKTTMLASLYGYPECVSIEGDKLSTAQTKLLKELGFDIDIIIMFDNDKNIEFVKKNAKQIKNRRIYIMHDKDRLLGNPELKHSPVDLGKDIFTKLLKNYTFPIDYY